jgi:phasin family protein
MLNFDDANKAGKDTMDTMLKSYSTMATGMQTIASEAAAYSKKSFEHSAAMVEKLSAAKSMEKVFEIQTDYAKSSYEAFVQQATKMGEIYADLAKDVYKPFERSMGKAAN